MAKSVDVTHMWNSGCSLLYIHLHCDAIFMLWHTSIQQTFCCPGLKKEQIFVHTCRLILTATITAIYKKGSWKMANNYRPVSLTCIACKVLESLIRDQIMDHMKRNALFSDKQYRFIGGRSTALQLISHGRMDEDSGWRGKYWYNIHDFMKAFDMVPHRRLLNWRATESQTISESG